MVYAFAEMRKFSFCLSFFSFSMFCHVCFSQLSSNQASTMVVLSRFLNISAWNFPNSEQNPCLWKGVSCSQPDNSSVTRLSLSGFGLSNSSFLPLVCKIETLESLDVSNNRLSSVPSGFVVDCGELDGLKLLNFSKNRFSSLPRFPRFAALEVLDFSYNHLSGSIGYEFDGLVNVKCLNLSYNKLTGSVPTNLGKSRSLAELKISDNSLNGVIPAGITSYQNLTLIDLSDNQLNGSIPDSIGNLSKLERFVLSNNHLTKEIPESISSIRTLERFAANQNHFTGSIPAGITNYLKYLDLSFNNLNGSIPADLLSQPDLVSVDLSFNTLAGSIPLNISRNLVRLRLGSNNLIGLVPGAAFAEVETLTYLELDNNTLTGTVPSELGLCKNLTLLNLALNELTGILPSELGKLSKLQGLKLQQNKLSGEIPVEITQLTNLLILNISWNSLNGSIPSSVSKLQKLSNMNLEGNNLSGTIPYSIRDLKYLIELQLAQNQLGGKINEMPPGLQISLNLSHNKFEGPLPSSLFQLTGLEVLDLSDNRFVGGIPAFLTELRSLTVLILSNNRFTGTIPEFRSSVVLKTDGNPGLKNSPTQDSQRGSSKKRKSIGVVILVSLAAAALVAGIITVIALRLSKRFYRINNMQLERSEEESVLPQVIHGSLLTANGLHRSSIDFKRAMEAVSDPANLLLKTSFSSYFKSIMPSGSNYFIKKLKLSDKLFQLTTRDKIQRELEILGKLSNSNVMIPLAYALSAEDCLLFYEFPQKGILLDVLHGNSGDVLDWTSRYCIAVGVAQGIAFLHGSNGSDPILLLDLSSRTITLKSLKEPQVGDIELLKVIDPSKSTSSLSAVAGSIGYIPPEYAYTMRVTTAGNVYSFGVILLELLTGKPAVSGGSELAKWVRNQSSQDDQLDQILDSNINFRTSPVAKSQMLRVLKVALACINISPGARPKMKTVLRMLKNAK